MPPGLISDFARTLFIPRSKFIAPAAAQDLQHLSNQSSEQFDGGGGGSGAVHPTREHEGHGLEVSLHFDDGVLVLIYVIPWNVTL